MGSAAFDYEVFFISGFYKIDQPNNLGLILDVEAAETRLQTHATNADWFVFNGITLDWRRCTNIVAGSREALMDAIAALNTSPPPPGVADVNLVQVGGAAITLGQTVMAASLPVTIASNQSALAVTIPTPVPVTQATTPWVVNETQIGGAAYTLGQKTMANSAPVVLASDQSSIPVAATQTTSPWVVSGTVTANQGTSPWVVNETQIGSAAYTLGQKTMANSAPVVIASDQSAVPVSGTLSSTPSIPATADIVGASRTTTGTLYTVPAGRTFYGQVSLSCSVSVLGSSQPTISVAAGGTPTGTIHQIICSGLALTTVANSNTIGNVYINGGAGGVAVTFTQGATGVSTGQICGRLL